MSDNSDSNIQKVAKSSIVKGKDVSLFSKILGGVFIITVYVVAIILNKKIPTVEETFSIMIAGVGITNILSFSIDLSMIIKNIKG